jgi:hypothetical protein
VTSTSTNSRKVVLCSPFSEQSGEDPAGSAWATSRIVIAELPLPWPEDLLHSPYLQAGLHDVIHELYEDQNERWGMIGIASDPDYSVPGMTRIFDLRQPGSGLQTYQRDSYLVPTEKSAELVHMLAFDGENPALDAHRKPDDQKTHDILICTHGSVDACCATFGFPIYKLLKAMANQAATTTRVWRCTHFGGHRFAATALHLPDGRYWGHLKADMLSKFVHRNAPVREFRRHYRGWAALAEPLWQIAEAELFAAAGWAWTDAAITGIKGQVDAESGGTLSISFSHSITGDATVDVLIEPAGSITTMDSSKTAEHREAPQFRAAIVREQPSDCLMQFAVASPTATKAGGAGLI